MEKGDPRLAIYRNPRCPAKDHKICNQPQFRPLISSRPDQWHHDTEQFYLHHKLSKCQYPGGGWVGESAHLGRSTGRTRRRSHESCSPRFHIGLGPVLAPLVPGGSNKLLMIGKPDSVIPIDWPIPRLKARKTGDSDSQPKCG